jgi:hypothetical protein
MTTRNPAAPGFKQRAKAEFKVFIGISLYLAFFFCALSTYAMMLLRKYDISYLNYTFAIVNAFVVGKIILLGEMVHFGKGAETRPLYQSALYKSILFGLLVFAFHLVEEFIKRRLIRHEPAGAVLNNINFEDLIARSIVIFCAFVPLFAFRELGRVIGEDKLHAIFFKHRAASDAALSPTKS